MRNPLGLLKAPARTPGGQEEEPMNSPANSPARALRLGRLLAVLAVWAGVLGYVIPAAFSAGPGVSATAAAVASHSPGGHNARRGSRLSSPRPSHQPGNALVRVIQASLRSHRVTVTVDGRALSHDQAFASVTPYRPVRPGTWTVRAVGASEQATARVTLAAGSSNTMVVLDGRGQLAIRVQPDTTGIKATARGAAGLGGTAPRPGWPAVAWLAPTATALLLGLAWLARLRQFRWARRVAGRIR
jgi:hypothetical protein